jgi:DNA replication licensing factor MCM3
MEIDDSQPDFQNLVIKFMSKSEVGTKIREMLDGNKRRLVINLDSLRNFSPELAQNLMKTPMKIVPFFRSHLQELTKEISENNDYKNTQKGDSLLNQKQVPYDISFEGTFGRNMVSPRGLTAELTNQLVCIQGIVTRMSIVRPKLVHSVHYCEDTKQGSVKEYNDQYSLTQNNQNTQMGGNFGNIGKVAQYFSNTVPTKDINGNPLTFEYGLSFFRDFQTLLIQEPPERTPVGQLPRSIEVILEDDLVDHVKPGDRYLIF